MPPCGPINGRAVFLKSLFFFDAASAIRKHDSRCISEKPCILYRNKALGDFRSSECPINPVLRKYKSIYTPRRGKLEDGFFSFDNAKTADLGLSSWPNGRVRGMKEGS